MICTHAAPCWDAHSTKEDGIDHTTTYTIPGLAYLFLLQKSSQNLTSHSNLLCISVLIPESDLDFLSKEKEPCFILLQMSQAGMVRASSLRLLGSVASNRRRKAL